MTYNKPTPDFAKYLLSYLSSRPDYETWINVISAIGNTFDQQTALNILLSHFHDEKPDEHLIKLKYPLSDINFGTLIYLAKKNGFKPETTHKNRFYGVLSSHTISTHHQKKKEFVTFDTNPELCYRFKDYEHQERAGIMEFDGGLTRFEAEKYILEKFPDAEKEREYRVGINENVLNKNLNPNSRLPYSDFSVLTKGFENRYLTIHELALSIGQGNPFICCHLISDNVGNTHRSTKNFLGSDIFGIDIDSGFSIEQAFSINETRKALLLYTTVNHSDKQNRFRIVFPFPRLIKKSEHYSKIVNYFINIYNADKQCKDPVRAFYGHDNTTIHIIQIGEILSYRNGVAL